MTEQTLGYKALLFNVAQRPTTACAPLPLPERTTPSRRADTAARSPSALSTRRRVAKAALPGSPNPSAIPPPSAPPPRADTRQDALLGTTPGRAQPEERCTNYTCAPAGTPRVACCGSRSCHPGRGTAGGSRDRRPAPGAAPARRSSSGSGPTRAGRRRGRAGRGGSAAPAGGAPGAAAVPAAAASTRSPAGRSEGRGLRLVGRQRRPSDAANGKAGWRAALTNGGSPSGGSPRPQASSGMRSS